MNYRAKDKNNIFIEFKHMLDHELVEDIIGAKIFHSNLGKKKSTIDAKLRKYQLIDKLNRRQAVNNRSAYVFDVMLPRNYLINKNIGKLKNYITELVNDFKNDHNLKYYAYFIKIGKARILRIVILNRIIDFSTLKFYEKDGKLIYDKQIVYISNKIRIPHFATRTKGSKEIFQATIEEYKLLLIRILTIKVIQVNDFIKKVSYKTCVKTYEGYTHLLITHNYYNHLKKRKIKAINTYIGAINEHMILNQEHSKTIIRNAKNKIKFYKGFKVKDLLKLEAEIIIEIAIIKQKN